MNTPDPATPLATVGDCTLTSHELMASLHRQGQLLPIIHRALAEKFALAAAGDAGVIVSDAELQGAADDFRRRYGLNSADATRAWLDREALTLVHLEDSLENGLLIEKFKDHLFAQHGDRKFKTDPDRYARVRLRQIVAPSEGVARELLLQLQDGAEFADLAQRNSRAGSRDQGGDLGIVCKADLSAAIAEPVFLALEGAVVGPLLAQSGYHLYRIEQRHPAELDGPTTDLIRREVFADWLRGRMTGMSVELEWLETANAGC
jgi:peptidyl-prolyl cis-trans isomerase C